MHIWITWSALGAVYVLAGCSGVPRDAAFRETAAGIAARTGQQPLWNRGGQEDRQVAEASDALFQKELTPGNAVALALLNNPGLQVTYEDLGIAQADLVQAGLLKNPVFSASVRFPARPYHAVAIGVEEEFIDLLFLPARKHWAEAELRATRARVGEKVVSLAADVRRTYYRLAAAQEIAAIQKDAQDAADTSADLARRLTDAGNMTELARDTYIAEAGRARLDTGDADLEVADARQDLARLMGLTLRLKDLHIAGSLPEIPREDPSEASLRKAALAQRFSVVAAREEASAMLQESKTAGAVAVFSGGGAGVEGVRDPDVKTTIGPAVSLPLPIFDQGQAAAARAQAQWRQSEARLRETEAEVTAQVSLAYAQMAAARQRATYDRQTLSPLRGRITAQTLQQYNGMLASPFALLTARREELSAKIEGTHAAEAYWIARAQMEQAIGGILPENP